MATDYEEMKAKHPDLMACEERCLDLEKENERLQVALKTAEEFENAVTWPIRRSFVELGEVTAGIPTWEQMVDAAQSIVQRVKLLEERLGDSNKSFAFANETIGKLEEDNERLRAAMAFYGPPNCDFLHHPPADRHKGGEECPVVKRIVALKGEVE